MEESNKELLELLEVPLESRDWEWEKSFFQAFVDGKVDLMFDQPQSGPDGWPYMFVETAPDSKEPSLKLLQWLSERGIGLALNVKKEQPDYVFSYGMIWSYRESAQFVRKTDTHHTGEVEFKEGESVVAGEPSKDYLPEYARNILRKFLKDQKLEDPRFLIVSKDQKNFDLCFSLESFGSPPKEEHSNIAEAISWFLPTNYSIVLVSESAFNKKFYSV